MLGKLLAGIAVSGVAAFAADAPAVTFHKDVEPILQANCQSCHRPGQIAPMSFLTYQATRPWAKAMKAATAGRKMPPWFANPLYGDFRNEPKLTPDDAKKIAALPEGAPLIAAPRSTNLKDVKPGLNASGQWYRSESGVGKR